MLITFFNLMVYLFLSLFRHIFDMPEYAITRFTRFFLPPPFKKNALNFTRPKKNKEKSRTSRTDLIISTLIAYQSRTNRVPKPKIAYQNRHFSYNICSTISVSTNFIHFRLECSLDRVLWYAIPKIVHDSSTALLNLFIE